MIFEDFSLKELSPESGHEVSKHRDFITCLRSTSQPTRYLKPLDIYILIRIDWERIEQATGKCLKTRSRQPGTFLKKKNTFRLPGRHKRSIVAFGERKPNVDLWLSGLVSLCTVICRKVHILVSQNGHPEGLNGVVSFTVNS